MDWEKILESEGMPAELPPLRCESIEKLSEYGKEISIVQANPVSAVLGSIWELEIQNTDGCLTRREKEIIQMKYMELMTERGIAYKLEISRRTVRKTISRAKEKMRKRLYRLEKLIERSHLCRP